ncbi:MAG: S-layer homology domain-containing protein [Candidatus Gracilibacteria bacterium]
MIFNKVYRGKFFRILILLVSLFCVQVISESYPKVHAQSIVTSDQIQSFYANGILSYENVAFKFIPEDARKIQRPDILIQRVQRFYSAYKDMMGDTPFNGQQISFVERCDAKEGKNDNSITNECPYGYAIGYWGYFVGTPDITITKGGIQNVIEDANNDAVTFGIAHELSHAFDFWDNAQYVYNSTSAEALANIKLVHAIDQTGIKIRLGSTTYASTGEFLNNFYMPFFDKYTNNRYSYSDLDDDNPVVGNKADMYLALLEKGIQKTSSTCFFDTLKRYPENSNLEEYSSTNKLAKLNQFLSLWSEQCQSSAIIDVFVNANFLIDDTLKDQVARFRQPTVIVSNPAPIVPIPVVIPEKIPEVPPVITTPEAVPTIQDIPALIVIPFTDIRNHFAENAILSLTYRGIVSGKSASTFAPDAPLTRAEASKIIAKAFITSESADSFVTALRAQYPNYTYVFFKDVDIRSWFSGYVGIMQTHGIIQKSTGDTFRPNQAITRAEFLKMILRARGDNIENLSTQYLSESNRKFSDVSENAWYYPIVYAGARLHIIDTQNSFAPNRAITRGEAAIMLQRSL